ncbi:hypothetical protein CEXT_582481, partial [Caerostris extrusa]
MQARMKFLCTWERGEFTASEPPLSTLIETPSCASVYAYLG